MKKVSILLLLTNLLLTGCYNTYSMRELSVKQDVFSQQRALSVMKYLTSKGIITSRLLAVGYGESQLKNSCSDGIDCTQEEHAVNDRIEFRVLN